MVWMELIVLMWSYRLIHWSPLPRGVLKVSCGFAAADFALYRSHTLSIAYTSQHSSRHLSHALQYPRIMAPSIPLLLSTRHVESAINVGGRRRVRRSVHHRPWHHLHSVTVLSSTTGCVRIRWVCIFNLLFQTHNYTFNHFQSPSITLNRPPYFSTISRL